MSETGLLFTRAYSQQAMSGRVDELTDIYQYAFAQAPWNEVGKCAKNEKTPTCPDGFSALQVGSFCTACELIVEQPAYSDEELRKKFTKPEDAEHHTVWYLEETGAGKISLAVLARITTAQGLRNIAFENNKPMQEWISSKYNNPGQSVVWIEDIFADTSIRESGNLKNFGDMCRQIATGSGESSEIAIRTLNPKVVSAAKRDFGTKCKIYDPVFNEVPDRGRFIKIAGL
ncbi:MAG: hypothetical protein WCJ60_01430 [bacterium]